MWVYMRLYSVFIYSYWITRLDLGIYAWIHQITELLKSGANERYYTRGKNVPPIIV